MAAEPRFCVVVPTRNVADYLAECLDSVLGQAAGELEVLVVDDASTDDTARLAEQIAAADPRVRVLRLPERSGPGPARNAALAVARGRYLLFVDGDDTLAPGALAAIAERIEQAGEPDVLMYGYARRYPDGREVPDPRSATLLAPALLGARDRGQLLKIIPAAWNKACRRDYLAATGLSFPPGIYEDLPWSYELLMTAGTLATLDRTCYRYRQRTDSNILSTLGLIHLDVIEQYDRVFAFLDAHPDYEHWRRPMFDRMALHVPTVLEKTARISAADRRTFFRAAAAASRRHRPAGYRPAGRLGIKVRLLERGGYPVFRAAQLANRLRRAAVRRPR